jgi:nucleotide-binding universal stress UspA family protein
MAEARTRRPIVVGVDGSPGSVEALRWAVRQADLTDAQLVALVSWHVRMPGIELVELATDLDAAAQEMLNSTLVEALGPQRAVTVEARTSSDKPAEALLRASEDAELIAVGPDAHGSVPDLPLGSVPERVISYSSCPVAVIRRGRPEPANRIVVGLDSSQASRHALAWALRQAKLIGASVDAVVAWDWAPRFAVYPYGPPDEVIEGSAQKLLDAELSMLTGEDRRLVSGRVIRGHPARVLTNAAEQADLLVVGRHGAGGGFRHMIGSVSSKCIRHAHVPVVVTH